MMEMLLGVLGSLLILLFFLWLWLGKKATYKTGTLLMDVMLVAVCIATVLCSMHVRHEKRSQEYDKLEYNHLSRLEKQAE